MTAVQESADLARSKRPVPALTEPAVARPPVSAERTLASGLHVVAVRRSAVPLVELRLRVPFAGDGQQHAAVSGVLASSVFSGTPSMSAVEIAAELQRVGGAFSAGVDPDRLLIAGNGLVDGLPRLLSVLNEVLTSATYPDKEVTTERDRLADQIQIALSQPSHLVRVAMLRRVYQDHPYSVELPDIAAVRAIAATQVRELHRHRVLPLGSELILVGDIDPAATLDLVESALQSWESAGQSRAVPPVPGFAAGPTLLVDRPGSVQSCIRVALPALGRVHPDYPALQLANLVFGGYFSSRLVENLREDKGYTYSPHSGIEHSTAGSLLVVSADVATEVTAPSLLEIGHELGRIAALPLDEAELEQARQYAIGTLSLSTASQAGLAGMLSSLASTGLGLDWLAEHPRRLASVTLDDVCRAAATYLLPTRSATVVLGDTSQIERPVSGLQAISHA